MVTRSEESSMSLSHVHYGITADRTPPAANMLRCAATRCKVCQLSEVKKKRTDAGEKV